MKLDVKTFLDRLRSLARLQNPQVVRQELSGARPEDIAEGFQRLTVQEGLAILKQLDPEIAGLVLVELPTERTKQLLSELPDSTLAHYLDILPMDDALDLREDLGEERFDILLEVIPKEDADEIRRLLAFPKGSVGRRLTEDFVEVMPDATMADVIQDIRQKPLEEYEMVNDIYVLNEDRYLLGVFSLRKAIRAHPWQTAREVMNEDVVTCNAMDSAEDAARLMSRYGFYALPVLDDRGRMLGIFTGDDAQAVLRDSDTEDVLKLGGVSGDAESYLSLGVWQLVKRRAPWLILLFFAETLTGSVLRHYGRAEESLSIAPITYFIPLLIGAGGNTGSQVTTTITRALAVNDIKSSDALLVFRREIVIAMILGLALGACGFLRAYVGWQSGFSLSFVVGLALPAIVIWAASVGSLLPLAAKRVGIDPAVMSAPFITTFVDATGLIIYFEIAIRILGKLS